MFKVTLWAAEPGSETRRAFLLSVPPISAERLQRGWCRNPEPWSGSLQRVPWEGRVSPSLLGPATGSGLACQVTFTPAGEQEGDGQASQPPFLKAPLKYVLTIWTPMISIWGRTLFERVCLNRLTQVAGKRHKPAGRERTALPGSFFLWLITHWTIISHHYDPSLQEPWGKII